VVLWGHGARFWGAAGCWSQALGCWGSAKPREARATLQAWQHACRMCCFLHLVQAWEMHGSGLSFCRKIRQNNAFFPNKGLILTETLMVVRSSRMITPSPRPAAVRKPRPRISALFAPSPTGSEGEPRLLPPGIQRPAPKPHCSRNWQCPVKSLHLPRSSLRPPREPCVQLRSPQPRTELELRERGQRRPQQ